MRIVSVKETGTVTEIGTGIEACHTIENDGTDDASMSNNA
jgi:hypothetical protein